MTNLFAAELLKLRTLRGTWGYLLLTIGLAALVAAGTIGAESPDGRLASGFQASLVTSTAGITTIISLLFSLTLVTIEFRHGTITPALLATPRRTVFIGAKLLAGSTAGLAIATLALVVVLGIAVIWLAAIDVPLEPGAGGEAAARVLLAALTAGALGAAYGCLIHAQVPAVVGSLIWLLVAEPLLGAILGLLDVDSVADYLPAAVLFAIGDPDAGGLAFLPAVAVGAAHIAAATAVAVVRTKRRDVT